MDQSPTNALATGDSHTYLVTIDTNADFAQYLPLQITLAWTDPPGDPAAALKLVNNLTSSSPTWTRAIVLFRQRHPGGQHLQQRVEHQPLAATNAPIGGFHQQRPAGASAAAAGRDYSVTVMGRGVNVNAVTAQTNSVVQDYALVIRLPANGEVPTAITVTDNGIVSPIRPATRTSPS